MQVSLIPKIETFSQLGFSNLVDHRHTRPLRMQYPFVSQAFGLIQEHGGDIQSPSVRMPLQSTAAALIVGVGVVATYSWGIYPHFRICHFFQVLGNKFHLGQNHNRRSPSPRVSPWQWSRPRSWLWAWS